MIERGSCMAWQYKHLCTIVIHLYAACMRSEGAETSGPCIPRAYDAHAFSARGINILNIRDANYSMSNYMFTGTFREVCNSQMSGIQLTIFPGASPERCCSCLVIACVDSSNFDINRNTLRGST